MADMSGSGQRAGAQRLGAAPDLKPFSAAELEAMLAAGQEVLDCQRVLAKTGHNIVGELLRGASGFFEWDHYPEGDVIDPETHAQYYYHAHPPEERGPEEHGHFHTFLRGPAVPAEIWKHGARAEPAAPASEMTHLIAIAMDAHGVPIRLFTTNRWVTGDTWLPAEHACALLDRFVIDLAHPSWPVNRWITAMIRLFRPQISALVRARDAAISRRVAATGQVEAALEDRTLEVLGQVDIDVGKQVRRIAEALRPKP